MVTVTTKAQMHKHRCLHPNMRAHTNICVYSYMYIYFNRLILWTACAMQRPTKNTLSQIQDKHITKSSQILCVLSFWKAALDVPQISDPGDSGRSGLKHPNERPSIQQLTETTPGAPKVGPICIYFTPQRGHCWQNWSPT